MNPRRRWLRISLWVMAGLAIGAAGAYFLIPSSPEQMLEAGEADYDRGVRALADDDNAEAARRFDEAVLQADKVLDDLNKKDKSGREQSDEELRKRSRLGGRALWLKARALRDRAFAHAAGEGKPLKLWEDTTTGEKYRQVVSIPDKDVRKDAILCVVRAAGLLPDDAEVQREALRVILTQPPQAWDWAAIEQLCRNLVALDPKDTRAHYLLAEFHYQQPRIDAKGRSSGPTPADKRSRKRMLEANTHAARARATATRTVWRTLYLQARIARWLRDDYARKRKEEAAQQQEKELRRLLLEEQGGVLARAEKDGGVTGLKFYDACRALGLHRMAVELVAEDARRGKADLAAVQKCLEGTLAFCERMGPAGADIDRAGECALAAAGAAEAAQPLLSDPPAAGWTGAVEKVEALGRKALAKEYPLPAPYARLARLLLREARLAGQRGEMARSSKLNDDAGRWIEDGLRLGRAAKFTDAELAELRALAAERDRSREGLK